MSAGIESEKNAVNLSILIPVRNEGLNLRIMLKILKSVVELPHEVLVVHDSVDDTSIDVCKELQPLYPQLRVIHNERGRGVINAIKSGVDAALGKYVLLFAADEVGPVLAIEDMIQLMERGCDFVSCTRYAYGGRRLGGSLVGHLLSKLANTIFHRLVNSTLTDCTTGIKMFRKTIFEKLNLESNPVGWAVAFEMAVKAQALGFRLGEVPIISIDRLYGGQSTFRLRAWLPEYLRWFWYGILKLRISPDRPRLHPVERMGTPKVLAGTRPIIGSVQHH